MTLPSGSLETSLVEWKLTIPHTRTVGPPDLGNFLSGMETGDPKCWPIRAHSLGNFLSGMETVSVQRVVDGDTTLETSLVEWKPAQEAASAMELLALGNFLSGMETHLPKKGTNGFVSPLETSLVEWKRGVTYPCSTKLIPWKLP